MTTDKDALLRKCIPHLGHTPDCNESYGHYCICNVYELEADIEAALAEPHGVVVPKNYTGATCAFNYVNGKHIPTVTVHFKDDDWKSRDSFISALLAAAKEPK